MPIYTPPPSASDKRCDPLPHLVVVMKMLPIQLLHSFLEFLGFQDELGGVVQARLQRTQLHLQVMYLREEGREEGRRIRGGQRFDDSCDIHKCL